MVQSRELKRGIVNEETIAKFGNRLQIQPTFLGPLLPTMNQDAGTTARAVQTWTDWIRDRVTWMLAAGEDTHEFERGSMVVKGDPEMMVGKYFTVERGPLQWDGYGIGVGHDFQPYRRYLTTIEYVRSNQWKRRQAIKQPWDRERATKVVPIP